MASGKPLSPSITAMRISCTPRFLSSLITASQNLAPSLCWIQRPNTSLVSAPPKSRTVPRTVPECVTSRGLSDAQIQPISGHESKKSLEIYQHHSLGVGELADQEAVQG